MRLEEATRELKTVPLEQWAVARDLRQKISERFRAEGIEMPLPQRVVWHRDAPDGSGGGPVHEKAGASDSGE